MDLNELSKTPEEAYHEGWLASQAALVNAPVRYVNRYEPDSELYLAFQAGMRSGFDPDEDEFSLKRIN